MSYDNWSFSRNGLMTIRFNSNVRDLNRDIRRKQVNKFRIDNNKTAQLLEEQPEQYTVFNSETKFDIDDSLNREELLQVLTVQNIKNIFLYSNLSHETMSHTSESHRCMFCSVLHD